MPTCPCHCRSSPCRPSWSSNQLHQPTVACLRRLLLGHLLLLLLGNRLLLLWRHVTHHARPLLWVHGRSPSAPLLVGWWKLPTTSLLDLLELLLNLRWQL